MSEQITTREAATLFMASLEARGATFRWSDAERHDFTCCLDAISDWRGLQSPDLIVQVILELRDDIRELMRECPRIH